MLLPESSCVYVPSFRSVVPVVCFTKVPFLVFWPGMNIERGVAL